MAWIRFGLQSIKLLNIFVTLILIVIAFLLLVKAVMFRSLWERHLGDLGMHFALGAEYSIVLSTSIILVCGYGLLCLLVFDLKHMPHVIYLIGLILLMALAIIGNACFLAEPREYNINVIRLKSKFGWLNPAQLDLIQRDFHCCGIEKYTDYIMIWKQWGAPYMETPSQLLQKSLARQARPNIRSLSLSPRDDQHFRKRPRRAIPLDPDSNSDPRDIKKSQEYRKAKEALSFRRTRFRNPAVFSEGWKWSSSVIGKAFHGIMEVVMAVGSKIWGVAKGLYNYMVPKIIRNWLALLWDYIVSWLDWILGTDHSDRRWWFGSGWDDIYFQHLMADGEQLLPLSCCKNPTKPCLGHFRDTYRTGCRKLIVFKWYMAIGDMIILASNFIAVAFIECIIIYVYFHGVRQCEVYATGDIA